MQTAIIRIILCVLITGALSLWGCASRPAVSPAEPNAHPAPVQVHYEGVTTAEILHAAEEVLTRMHFAIEKLDVEQGIIRTRPLRGGQFFELWRSDNASLSDWEEANLQSIRRSVELRVAPPSEIPEGGSGSPSTASTPQSAIRNPVTPDSDPGPQFPSSSAAALRVTCTVSVQRLSLWANEVAGTSAALQIHASSTDALQRIRMNPQQQTMAWIDVGQDPALATRILERVEQRLKPTN